VSIAAKDLYQAPNGLYPVTLNGHYMQFRPKEVAGFTESVAVQLVNGKHQVGEKAGQPFAFPYKPSDKEKAEIERRHALKLARKAALGAEPSKK
jgi:hypothetical protein